VTRDIGQECGCAEFESWQRYRFHRRDLALGSQYVECCAIIRGGAEAQHCGISSFRRIGEFMELDARFRTVASQPAIDPQRVQQREFVEEKLPGLNVRCRKWSVLIQFPQPRGLDQDFCTHGDRREPTQWIKETCSFGKNAPLREVSDVPGLNRVREVVVGRVPVEG